MQVACLIADDLVFQDVRRRLSAHHFSCARCSTDVDLLRGLQHAGADVGLIDVGWAGAQEQEHLLAWLEARRDRHTPVVMQMADARSTHVARSLEAGAADVVTRGTDALELAARLHAAIRRYRGKLEAPILRACGFELDRHEGSLRDHGEEVLLTPREFALAWLLFSHLGDCVSRRTISLSVWGVGADISNRTMEQHVHSLRKKLQLGVDRGVQLRAVYGKGYQLVHQRQERQEPQERQVAEGHPGYTDRFLFGATAGDSR
ncbi:response regulator transcription factor [Ideonella sp. DXS29W]|uniref:Response regulator transcription factor n=1 Tax=Ideonella lacteola TaxID=2984193 RepID=A0ABU9BIP2_9BURK